MCKEGDMKYHWIGTAILFGSGLLLPAFCAAQQAAPPPSSGINIALLDIPQVFKNHPGFTQRSEEIKKEMKDLEAQFLDQRKVINDKRAALSQYKVGSPEFERLEKEIANQVANLQVSIEQRRRDILEREAKLYYDTYNEILTYVDAFCKRHNIALVLNHDSEPIDPTDHNSVRRGITRPVIYQDRIDITPEIIRMINAPRAAVRPK
jgi:Skp family chaperone for outer membrane proteins